MPNLPHHQAQPNGPEQSTPPTTYKGRFAPSPTGPLHMGSLLAALASHQHAQQHGGKWLIRIEDVDTMRAQDGMAATILQQLEAHGFTSDEAVVYQSQRSALYESALQKILDLGLAYPCTCSRKDIHLALEKHNALPSRNHIAVYPGTCRNKAVSAFAQTEAQTETSAASKPPAIRLNTALAMQRVAEKYLTADGSKKLHRAGITIDGTTITWHDERLGKQTQDLLAEVGDFVLKRADGCYSYQLAVVVDDAAQGITHVVRGADLTDNTPRQILLQLLLDLPLLHYHHSPLILAENGEKLSKQNGAVAVDAAHAKENLTACAQLLQS